MRQIQPDLWETEVESPFPGLTTHAYLLTRDEGNVLFYNTGHRHEIEAMAELGGVAWQFLSHRDELGETLNLIAERFGARLGGHAAERAEFAHIREPDLLFERRETLLGNIEVIPTPGHSPGSTCFMVQSPQGGRYLFTGDTVYRSSDGGWRPGFIPGHSKPEDRPVLAASLRLLRELEPDLVLGSAFGGDAGFERMRPGDWRRRVDEARDRLLKAAG
jgi:hydroxyacylglutathione hydrolase